MQRITIMPGVASLLVSASSQADAIVRTLSGDLSQMAAQERFLSQHGFNLGRNGGTPGFFQEEEYERALRFLWSKKFDGWWNYRSELIRLELCSPETYLQALRDDRQSAKT